MGKFRYSFAVALSIFISLSFANAKEKTKETQLKAKWHKTLSIPESSDVVFDSTNNHLYIVSDRGALYETDTAGIILRKSKLEGLDFEGIDLLGDQLYISDETPRKVYCVNKHTLEQPWVKQIQWGGALNKAYETICYNPVTKRFILIAEAPPVIVEYDTAFNKIDQHYFKYARDINSAKFFNGFVYLLSSKDRKIFKCNATTLEPLESYIINVYNAEGLCFTPQGNIYVVSDDWQRLYYFEAFKKSTE